MGVDNANFFKGGQLFDQGHQSFECSLMCTDFFQREQLAPFHVYDRLDVQQRAQVGRCFANAPAIADVIQRPQESGQAQPGNHRRDQRLNLRTCSPLPGGSGCGNGQPSHAHGDIARVYDRDWGIVPNGPGCGQSCLVGPAEIVREMDRNDFVSTRQDITIEHFEFTLRGVGGFGYAGGLGLQPLVELLRCNVLSFQEAFFPKVNGQWQHMNAQ